MAVTLRISALSAGEKDYAENLSRYRRSGFPVLDVLCERLKDYEADRKRYPSLRDFYPRMEEGFLENQRLSSPAALAAPKKESGGHHKESGVSFFLAGDYTASDYPATLEAAVRSGIRCAALVAGLRDPRPA